MNPKKLTFFSYEAHSSFIVLFSPLTKHNLWRRKPLSRVSRKQRYNTLDFPAENRVPTGMLAPLLETQRQRDVPFEIPHFPLQCIYKLRNAA